MIKSKKVAKKSNAKPGKKTPTKIAFKKAIKTKKAKKSPSRILHTEPAQPPKKKK